MKKSEVNVSVQKLLDMGTANISGFDDCGANDLDGGLASAVLASHFSVKLLNSSVQGNITEFLVHVVGPGTRIVPEPDAVVLDVVRVLFENLRDDIGL